MLNFIWGGNSTLYSDVIFLEMPFSRNIFCAFRGFVMLGLIVQL